MYPKIFRSRSVKNAIASRMIRYVIILLVSEDKGIIEGDRISYLELKSNALICHFNMFNMWKRFPYFDPKSSALICQHILNWG